MKTVNQSLGRALRHCDDYGSIILIDQRYTNYIHLLSSWIKKKIQVQNFLTVFKEIHGFLCKS